MKVRAALAIVVVGLFLWALLHWCNYNKRFQARLRLLAHGYVLARLAPADRVPPEQMIHAFASYLVYKGSTYLGYIDGFGEFIPAGDGEPNYFAIFLPALLLWFEYVLRYFRGVALLWLVIVICLNSRLR